MEYVFSGDYAGEHWLASFALYAGWLRIKSGSIAGPWLIHATINVTVALVIAARTVG